MAHFANLSESERERLEMLIEEAGEVVTIGTKILRHGYESWHPDDKWRTHNRVLLEKELKDLAAVARTMDFEHDLTFMLDGVELQAIWEKKLQWTHHQSYEQALEHQPPDPDLWSIESEGDTKVLKYNGEATIEGDVAEHVMKLLVKYHGSE